MKNAITTCLLLILVSACSGRDTQRAKISAQALDQASAVAAASLAAQHLPGVALVVMQGDKVLLSRGYGVESIERKDAVTGNTVFLLNSITKQFVAAMILALAEDGKLSVEDPVAKHLPDFTQLPPGLKVRHLLDHTSGIREDPGFAKLDGIAKPTDADLLAIVRHVPSEFTPGSRWSYSNSNYLMLSQIVERVSGKGLEAAMNERLFRPLGLSSMRICPNPMGAPGFSLGHKLEEGVVKPRPSEDHYLVRGPGGHCGSALDLARWVRALATGKVVSAASHAQMTAKARLDNGRTADYGFGTVLLSPDGAKRIGHGGYGTGFSAQSAYYPDAELTVVILTNRFAFPEYIERKISRRLLGLPDPVMREVATTAAERQRYAGVYDIGVHGWEPPIVERDGRLWFEMGVLPPMPLIYLGNHEFADATDIDSYRFRFTGVELGKPELELLGMGMATWYGVRRP